MKRFNQRRIRAYEDGEELNRSNNFYASISLLRKFGSAAGVAAGSQESNWER